MSSAAVVGGVKRLLGAEKVGHAGTLDPFATGVLVCCVNKATRLAEFFVRCMKTYRAVMALGTATDTQDATGTVVSTGDPTGVSADELRRAARSLTGEILQAPPVYSALKHQGVPLYKFARRGESVQKPPRKVFIERLDVLDVRLPDVEFEVACSAGTYVRTLCADMGARLGCGGHLRELRRTQGGGFTIDEAVAYGDLKTLARDDRLTDRIVSMSDALRGMPGALADAGLLDKIATGKLVTAGELAGVPQEGFFKVLDDGGRLAAVLHRNRGESTLAYRCVFPVTEMNQQRADATFSHYTGGGKSDVFIRGKAEIDRRVQDPRQRYRITRGAGRSVDPPHHLSHRAPEDPQEGPSFEKRIADARRSSPSLAQLCEEQGRTTVPENHRNPGSQKIT